MHKIISGGQTGVDQAALQVAIDIGIEHGGWCPPGRNCENGIIPEQFRLDETPEERDPMAPNVPRSQRTIWNVRDSDGTLVILQIEDKIDKGTDLALKTAKKLNKPFLANLFNNFNVDEIQHWIDQNEIRVLSVGGPSEKTSPGIYQETYQLLRQVLDIK